MAFLEIENLSFTYPNCDEKALDGVNISVSEGSFCLVVGKSGSGKSTLLRLLKKEIAPSGKISGKIKIVTDNIGFVSQNVESNIVTDTVSSELAFSLENKGVDREKAGLKIAETASYFNLNGVYNDKTDSLSGGTKQLLSLASVVISNPDMIIFDEPVSQLDPVSAENFLNTVLKLNREQGITVIISSHKIDRLLPIADKIIYLENGAAKVFDKPQRFADFLLEGENDFKSILPAYTQVLSGAPIDFITAKKQISNTQFAENHIDIIDDNEKALFAKNLCFAYKKGQKNVLFRLNFCAYKGKINAVVGANGSGKTTLLKILSGIYKPYSGKVKAYGKICYMPQNVKTMFLKDTVFEELDCDDIYLKQFGLMHLKSRNPFDLSGGEEQRLAIAKIVKTGADIILLDEPTKSVDAPFKAELAEMLKSLCRKGKTIVIVTHDLEFAGRYCDFASFLFDSDIIVSDERKRFFANLDVYTTVLSRLTNGRAICVDDIKGYNE